MLTFLNNLLATTNTATPGPTLSNMGLAASIDASASTQDPDNSVQKVQYEMNRRAENVAYGFGYFIGKLIGTIKNEPELERKVQLPKTRSPNSKKIKKQEVKNLNNSVNITAPFLNYYNQLFPQDTLRVIYIELDPGVDDGAALLQLLAAKANSSKLNNGKKIEIMGIIPSVGNAILPQTEQNTLQFLEITNNQNIKVYPGAEAPLAIENNQTAINEMKQGINATHFYGGDGEENIGGWPQVNIEMQAKPGYKFAADTIYATSSDKPITLVSTSVLTNLAKTFVELERLDKENGLLAGSFAKKINAISIMGGCLNPAVGCNAPFNVPDNQKNSEANFYFGPEEAQIVFSICQKYGIPILLAPLDLTQQPGLLWTKEQVNTLNRTNNPVAKQMAKVTNVVPYLDAPCFPNETYPMHDLQATANFLYPDFYDVTRIAASIGNVGQIQINENATEAQKNIYVLGMSVTNQAKFYQTILPEYHHFDPANNHHFTTFEILASASSGVLLLSGAALSLYCAIKCSKKTIENNIDEEKALLPKQSGSVNSTSSI